MIMDFGQNPRRDNQTRPGFSPAPSMAQIHAGYQARIADLERELVAARQYIARLQAELARQGGGAPAATPAALQAQPAPQIDPSVRAFYGDHLGCSHPHDIGGDEMEE